MDNNSTFLPRCNDEEAQQLADKITLLSETGTVVVKAIEVGATGKAGRDYRDTQAAVIWKKRLRGVAFVGRRNPGSRDPTGLLRDLRPGRADALITVAEHFLATRGQQHCNLDDKHWISPKTAKRLASAAPDVDAGTCVTRWCREHCDYDIAITALMRRDEGASNSPASKLRS